MNITITNITNISKKTSPCLLEEFFPWWLMTSGETSTMMTNGDRVCFCASVVLFYKYQKVKIFHMKIQHKNK